jgi:hypothetical protein
MKIKLLPNSEIDLIKWDSVVLNAANTRIYAESWYLDMISPDWYGLIADDYKYVMPVVDRSKWGIRYAFQPTYAQQHGIFPPSTPEITTFFIDKLKEVLPYFNISMNVYNLVDDTQLSIENRKNYILSLNHDVDQIQKAYSKHSKRYVKKAQQTFRISTDITHHEYLLLRAKYSHQGFTKVHLEQLKLIIFKSLQNKRGVIYGAYSEHNELCAAAFFLIGEKRFVYLNSVSSPEGKASRAMYGIIDQFIVDHSQMHVLLDFEGSNVEGIARFFEGFGAAPETYQNISFNNLPWYIKWLKK